MTLTLPELATIVDVDDVDIAELMTCACGAVTAPDGTCLEIGACERADSAATRTARGQTRKFVAQAPAGWTGTGRVD